MPRLTRLSDMSVLVASASADSAYIPTELQIVGEAELRLEEQLQEMIDGWGAPGARLSPAQIDAADGVARQLERLRGRQQRAGWGQSDSRYDLPMIGAWDVLYSSEPADYAPEPGGPRLVSARQGVYGPGVGGFGSQCVYAASASSPASGDLLLVRYGNVTKLDGPQLRLDLAGSGSRAYSLRYATLESVVVPSYNGSAPTTREVERRLKTPAVGPLVASTLRLCAPAAGTRRTTYLSDTLWLVRASDGGGGLTVSSPNHRPSRNPKPSPNPCPNPNPNPDPTPTPSPTPTPTPALGPTPNFTLTTSGAPPHRGGGDATAERRGQGVGLGLG